MVIDQVHRLGACKYICSHDARQHKAAYHEAGLQEQKARALQQI